jgi:hypothetical protein
MDNTRHAAARPDQAGISRRRVLGTAATLAAGLAGVDPASAAGALAPQPQVRLTLPAPTGPYPIGTVSLHLVDRGRQDPFWSTPHPRELMVNVWYPSRHTGHGRRALWMSAGALAHYRPELEEFLSFSPDTAPGQPPINTPVSLDGVDFPVTHAGQAVPVAGRAHPYPVVLYSPGYAAGRELGTTLVEDLASHGYVVVTISNTYEAWEVEFPGGRVELGRHDLANPENDLTHDTFVAVQIRVADARFVLDRLTALQAGRNPDAEQRLLPAGLGGSLNLARIGMFGHSLGGATAAQTIAHDSRVIAGIDLDGSFIPDLSLLPPTTPEQIDEAYLQLADRIGSRPFMIMGSKGYGPDDFGVMTSIVWHNLRGWRRFVSLVGSTHGSYTDHEPPLHQLAAAGVIQPAAPWVGTIDPDRAIAAQRAYIRAFFDLWLRDHDSHLLDGPSAEYPEARFYL